MTFDIAAAAAAALGTVEPFQIWEVKNYRAGDIAVRGEFPTINADSTRPRFYVPIGQVFQVMGEPVPVEMEMEINFHEEETPSIGLAIEYAVPQMEARGPVLLKTRMAEMLRGHYEQRRDAAMAAPLIQVPGR